MSKVVVKFVNTEREYGEATRLYFSRTKRIKIDTIIGIAVLLYGIWLWMIEGYSLASVFFIGVGVLGFSIRYLSSYILPQIRFKQEPKFKDEYTLIFGDEGLEFKTEHLNSKLDWTYYYKALESNNLYLLMYGKGLFTIVPKRAFNNKEQESEFRNMISKNLRDGIERT